MQKAKKNSLLDKYYSGSTSLSEEALLKEGIMEGEIISAEKDAFAYYSKEATVPEGLEDDIFNAIKTTKKKKKVITRSLISITSIAASIVIILSIYTGSRNRRYKELENSFFVMEKAMFQVSENIRPAEQEEMLVLWIDEDTPIIIN